jgi:hypothetical protein
MVQVRYLSGLGDGDAARALVAAAAVDDARRVPTTAFPRAGAGPGAGPAGPPGFMQRHWKPIIGGLTLLAAGLWGWSIFARDWR